MERRHVLLAAPTLLLVAGGCGVSLRRAGESGQSGGSAAAAEDKVPRIDVDAARAEVQAGRAILVDVRSQEAYQRSRAAAATLLPLSQIEDSPPAAAKTLPAGLRPILYCT
jgi:hypothetical protein